MSHAGSSTQQIRHRTMASTAAKTKAPFHDHLKWQQPNNFALILCVGSNMVSGFADFPIRCYSSGGFIFLVIYLLMFFGFGLPMVILECQFGQFLGQTNINVMRHMCPLAGGIGIVQIIITFAYLVKNQIKLAVYFNYLFTAIAFSAPWLKCGHEWSSTNCITKHQNDLCALTNTYFWNNTCYEAKYYCEEFNMSHTDGNLTYCISNGTPIFIPEMININRTTPGRDYFLYMMTTSFHGGALDGYFILNALLAWLIIITSLHKGITKTGIQVCYILVLTSTCTIVFLFVATLMYSGSFNGIIQALYVNLDVMWDIKIWLQAVIEVMHSLNLGLGVNTAIASCNHLNANFIKSIYFFGIYTSVVEQFFYQMCLYSLWGIISEKTNKQVPDIAREYPGPVAILLMLPDLVQYHPAPQFWALLLLLVVICKNIATNIISLETIILSCGDVSRHCRNRPKTIRFLISIVGWILGLIFPMNNNGYQIATDYYRALNFELEVIAIIELLVFGLVYGFASHQKNRQFKDLKDMVAIDDNTYLFFRTAHYFFTPVVAVVYLILKVLSVKFTASTHITLVIILLDVIKSIVIIVGYAVYVFWNIKFKKYLLYSTYTPTFQWVPQSFGYQSKYKPEYARGSWKYKIAVLANKINIEL